MPQPGLGKKSGRINLTPFGTCQKGFFFAYTQVRFVVILQPVQPFCLGLTSRLPAIPVAKPV